MALFRIPDFCPESTGPIFDALARALSHAEAIRLALSGLEPESSAAALHGVVHHLVEELRAVEIAIARLVGGRHG